MLSTNTTAMQIISWFMYHVQNSTRPLSLSHWHFCRANSQSHKVTVSPSLCLSTCTSHTSSSFVPRIPFVIGICLLHMYPYLLMIILILGHTCEISYCTAICVSFAINASGTALATDPPLPWIFAWGLDFLRKDWGSPNSMWWRHRVYVRYALRAQSTVELEPDMQQATPLWL